MPNEKHEIQPEPDGTFDRRKFFVKVGLGSLSIAAAGTAVFAYQFLSPNVLYEPSPIVNAGKPESYPCLLYTSPSPRDRTRSRMPSSA